MKFRKPEQAQPEMGRSLSELLRHPQESSRRRVLAGSLGVISFLLVLASFGAALLVGGLLLGGLLLLVRIQHQRFLGNAARVGDRQYPELNTLCTWAARRLAAPEVQVFVAQHQHIHSYAFGWSRPQAVVLTSGLVEAMAPDEFRFWAGHELGHVVLGHTRLNALLGGLGEMSGVTPLLPLQLLFNSWSRLAEYSADRAGLVACGSLQAACSALVKLMVGPALVDQIDLQTFLGQAQDGRHRQEVGAAELLSRNPHLANRLQALAQFWGSAECCTLLAAEPLSATA